MECKKLLGTLIFAVQKSNRKDQSKVQRVAMYSISAHHHELFNSVLQSRIVQTEFGRANEVLQKWEPIYEGAYLRWTEDNASAAAYDTLRTIRAYLKGDGHFSPGDLWSRHLLARCFILEAREPNVGEKQVRLRGEALQYCTELKRELSNATEPLVSPEDIAKMEELILLERSVFESEPHPSALQKFKVKASGFFGRS
ncbi:MAG: hypothetical protein L6R42_005664 [Xanthoria sp. 1 TBL-2021]|nr:MAG: hypothetical protein L6R42_005664 [Xanthoria sp. 1 TBL-2021]